MKISYIFDTSDEKHDPDELFILQNARDFYCALIEIDNLVRNYQKYEEKDDLDPKISQLLELIREEVTNSGARDIL